MLSVLGIVANVVVFVLVAILSQRVQRAGSGPGSAWDEVSRAVIVVREGDLEGRKVS